MLHFFRKIRHDLIANSKSYKYFKYAIGEVVLVVLGILIALAINNWNEERKVKKTELKLLTQLTSELSRDLDNLNFDLSQHEQAVNSCKIILNILNSDIEMNDSISHHFAAVHNYTIFASLRGAYESLKSVGLETVSNDELRLEITNLYDQWYLILKSNEKILLDDILNIKRNFNQDHFDKFLVLTPIDPFYNGEMNPNDFSSLKMNHQYKYHVESLMASHIWSNLINKIAIDKIKYLRTLIQAEIDINS